jgi:hypothetical protein
MISERCRGRCLINHCKQVGLPKDLEIDYLPVKNYTGPALDDNYYRFKNYWVCAITFGEETFRTYSSKRNDALEKASLLADKSLRTFVKTKNHS